MDFINGNKFLELADFAIDFNHNNLSTEIFKKDAIIFCKTDFLDMLFNYIKFSARSYTLITHMSDYPINKVRYLKSPFCVKKWYAQNAILNRTNLISIPLGLENHKGSSKGSFTNHKWLEDNIDDLKEIPKDGGVYCNWNTNTNQEIREPILEELKQNDLQLCIEHGLSFEEYCTSMAHHQYVICPPGNGADTHRLWEALYMGCIPITLENRIYNNYHLPIIQVKKWSDVTKELLYSNLISIFKNIDKKQLYMTYWINLIKN